MIGQVYNEATNLNPWQEFVKVVTYRTYASRVGALLGELFIELNSDVIEFHLKRTTIDNSAKWAVNHNLDLLEHGKFNMVEFKTRYQRFQAFGKRMMYSINPSVGLYLKYRDREYKREIALKDMKEAIESKSGLAIFIAAFPDLKGKLEAVTLPEELKTEESPQALP
jgi:hypothetical protein